MNPQGAINPLGATTQIETASGAVLTNSFNTIAVNEIDSVVPSSSVAPTKIGSGMSSGAQKYLNTDGSYMLVGFDADAKQIGIFFYDASGNLQAKYLGATDFKYRSDGTNYYQSGVLPDGTYNLAIANPDTDVPSAFS